MTLLDGVAAEALRKTSLPTLETERLVLRAPRLADAEQLALLLNDRRIAENTARLPHPYSVADAEDFIGHANKRDGEASFLVTRPDGALIGGCGVGVLSGSDPEIGYWLGVAHWGQGYATEAARAVIDYSFTMLSLDTLQAGARVSNPASRRVLEKCGFQWSGVVLQRIRALSSSAPCDRFRLDLRLWTSLRSWGAVRKVA